MPSRHSGLEARGAASHSISHLTNALTELGSSRGKAFQESSPHGVRNGQPACESSVTKQTVFQSSNVGDTAASVSNVVFCSCGCWVRGYQFDAIVPEPLVQFVGVVGAVSDEILWGFLDCHLQQGGFGQLHFVRRGTFNGNSHGKTMSVCHGHDPRSLATFCFADLRSPFFAETKLTSMKASRRSRRP